MQPDPRTGPDQERGEQAAVLREVRRIEIHSRRLASDLLAGGYASAFRGAGIEFHEVREYAAGDDPRSIDWNVTARVGRPFVKLHVDERELSVVFLLDLSPSMDAGFGAWSPRQAAARVLASLALSAVHSGDRVGLLAFGRGHLHFVPPRKGKRQALRLVRDALTLPSPAGACDPAPALDFARRALAHRSVLFVLSDFLGPGFGRPLRICARRHDVVAVRLEVPELASPRAGTLRLVDPEGGGARLLDWRDPALRAAYGARVAAWRGGLTSELRRAGVDEIAIALPRTAHMASLARPLMAFFRLRELRRRRR